MKIVSATDSSGSGLTLESKTIESVTKQESMTIESLTATSFSKSTERGALPPEIVQDADLSPTANALADLKATSSALVAQRRQK